MPVSRFQFEHHLATLRENWPDELSALATTCHAIIPLSASDRASLADGAKPVDAFAELMELIPANPDGLFLKVCGFSWKGTKIFSLTDGKVSDRLDLDLYMSDIPPRVSRLLDAAPASELPGSIEVYQWRQIEPWTEFRMFMHNGDLAGASQYFASEHYPQIPQNLGAICRALLDLARRMAEASHLETVVADVFVDRNEAGLVAKLIELNPFHRGTGVGLYSWANGGNFDGRLRFRGTGGRLMGASFRSVAA